MVRFLLLFILILCLSCKGGDKNTNKKVGKETRNSQYEPLILAKPLLVTRFSSLDDFKSKIQIKYVNSLKTSSSKVQLKMQGRKSETQCELRNGISQNDIAEAKNGSLWDKINFTMKCPYAVRNRKNLEKVFNLARRQASLFGMRDVAFYDLATAMTKHINSDELAYKSARDSGEKGYMNTFNHVAAQAIITSVISEELACFIADAHERKNMPELISGNFTPAQLQDTNNYPEDNYADIVNNKIGQELGLALKEKYKINTSTFYSAELVTNYLNDLQSYFNWSLGIGFDAFDESDEVIVRFTYKLNEVLNREN